MKILQVAASAARSDGGPTTGVIELNRAYNRLPGTSSIAIVSDADGYHGWLSAEERADLSQEGLRLIITPRSRPFRLKHSWRLLREVWRTTPHVDLLHVHGVYLAHTAWAFAAAKRWGRPYIVQPHGALEPYQAAHGRFQKWLWDATLGRRILCGAVAVIAASEPERDNLRRLLPVAPVVVSSLGVSDIRPRRPRNAPPGISEWLSRPRRKRVLFLGRLARKKRPDLLLEAWSRLQPNAMLAVVGPDGEWSREDLLGMIPQHVQRSVVFTEPVDAAGVSWFMRHAGIFVLPSENENFGLTIVEAMAGACAVITSCFAAASTHVEVAGAGVVLDRLDPALLESALAALLEDPTEADAMGSRAQTYTTITLSWDSCASRLLSGVKVVLDSGRTSVAKKPDPGSASLIQRPQQITLPLEDAPEGDASSSAAGLRGGVL